MSEKPNNEDKLEFIHRLDSLAIQKQKEEIERLQAEVERLRSLGCDVANEFVRTEFPSSGSCGDPPCEPPPEFHEFPLSVQVWFDHLNAAKEGKQSEEVLWVQLEDYEKLKAENEHLRKAGDAMADAIYEADPEKLEAHKKFKLTEEEYNAVQLWNAAKEGKHQS